MELDPAILSQIRGIGGDKLVGKLARMFLELTPVRLEEIRRALASGDWHRTSNAIHSLRSSSATLGATALADRAGQLERLAAREEREALEAAFPELEEEARAVLANMQKLGKE